MTTPAARDDELRCSDCGARCASRQPWCPVCFAPVQAPDPRFAPWSGPQPRPVPPPVVPACARRPLPRLARTDVTFGVRGRVALTLVALLPFALGVYTFFFHGWALIGIYGFFVFPLVLRDLWRRPDVGGRGR